MHGGEASAFSEGQDKGATFTITLPVIQTGLESESQAVEVIEDLPPLPSTAEFLKDVFIHVVDDDVDSCGLLEFAFKMRGARVRTSNSAADAFREISSEAPDILLADINMPDEDGYSLIRRVREIASGSGVKLPAIALTAMARSEDSDQAISAGFDLHVPKPIEIEELTSAIRELLQNAKTMTTA
jgi:hypothetical protein